jgi:hypothetical protein
LRLSGFFDAGDSHENCQDEYRKPHGDPPIAACHASMKHPEPVGCLLAAGYRLGFFAEAVAPIFAPPRLAVVEMRLRGAVSGKKIAVASRFLQQ